MVGIEIFHYMKPTTVDIKMNVAFLEIRRKCFPQSDFRMSSLHLAPCGVTDAAVMEVCCDEKKIENALAQCLFNLNNHTTNNHSGANDAVGLGCWFIKGKFYCLARNDFAIVLEVIVSCTEFNGGTIQKRFLVIEDKLPTVVGLQRCKCNIESIHNDVFV